MGALYQVRVVKQIGPSEGICLEKGRPVGGEAIGPAPLQPAVVRLRLVRVAVGRAQPGGPLRRCDIASPRRIEESGTSAGEDESARKGKGRLTGHSENTSRSHGIYPSSAIRQVSSFASAEETESSSFFGRAMIAFTLT